MWPLVSATSVKEWPDPTALTVRPAAAARATMARTSPVPAGRSTTAGAQCCSRARLLHMDRIVVALVI